MTTVDPAYVQTPQPPTQNQAAPNADGTATPAFAPPPGFVPPTTGAAANPSQVPAITGPLPVGAPATAPSDAPKTFSDLLFDKFTLVWERVTRGRRDLKHIKDVFDQRAIDERAAAKQIGVHGSAIGDVQDSSSLQPVWQCVKEQAITTAKQRESFAACCTELSAILSKSITDIKVAKTRLNDNHNRVVADVQKKQALHDRARQVYGDATKAAERAIIDKDNGLKQPVPPKRQVQLDQSAQMAVRTVDGRAIEYGAAVTALAASQRAYDLGIADIMKQLEQIERERLRVLHDVLNRYAAQHEALKRAVEAQTEALYRVLSTVNTADDIQKFIMSNTSHPRIRPHVENIPIISPVVENYRKNPTGPPQMLQQQIPPYGVPPMQQPMPMQQPPFQQQQSFPQQQFPQPPFQQQQIQQQQQMQQQQMQQPQPLQPMQQQPYPPIQHQQSLTKIVPPPPPNGFVPPVAVPTATALFDFDAVEADDLPFKAGQTIKLVKCEATDDWWTGELDGRQGIFPKTYVKKIETSPPQQQQVPSYAPNTLNQQPQAPADHYQAPQQQTPYGAPQYQTPPVTNTQHPSPDQYQAAAAPQYQPHQPPPQQQPTQAPGAAPHYNPNAVIAPPGTQTLVAVLAPTKDAPRYSNTNIAAEHQPAPAAFPSSQPERRASTDYNHAAPPQYNEAPAQQNIPAEMPAPAPAQQITSNGVADPGAAPAANPNVNGPVEGVGAGIGIRGKCSALFDFEGQDGDELSFKRGQILIITDDYEGWYLGHIEGQAKVGLFPSNHVQLIS